MPIEQIQQSVVDGVATLWARCPGPLRAALVFRVGQADESFLTSGQTHAIEHLAFAGLVSGTTRHNGSVDQTRTIFHTAGSEDDVRDFVERVCEQLRALPGRRLEKERLVLAAERASHRRGIHDLLLCMRFGAQGYGLAGIERVGERTATLESLQRWSSERFNRSNAVLCLSGPPPAGLVAQLPDGEPFPAPEPETIISPFASWFVQDLGGIAAAAVLPTGVAGSVLATIASDELMRWLRTDRALSYAPNASLETWTTTASYLALTADSTPQRRRELAAEFAELVGRLPRTREEPFERARVQLLARLREQSDSADFGAVVDAGGRLLGGRPAQSIEELRAAIEAVTLDDVRAAGQAFASTALFAIPPESRIFGIYGDEAPRSLAKPVRGKRIRHVDRSGRQGGDRVRAARLVTVRRYGAPHDGAVSRTGGCDALGRRGDDVGGSRRRPIQRRADDVAQRGIVGGGRRASGATRAHGRSR